MNKVVTTRPPVNGLDILPTDMWMEITKRLTLIEYATLTKRVSKSMAITAYKFTNHKDKITRYKSYKKAFGPGRKKMMARRYAIPYLKNIVDNNDYGMITEILRAMPKESQHKTSGTYSQANEWGHRFSAPMCAMNLMYPLFCEIYRQRNTVLFKEYLLAYDVLDVDMRMLPFEYNNKTILMPDVVICPYLRNEWDVHEPGSKYYDTCFREMIRWICSDRSLYDLFCDFNEKRESSWRTGVIADSLERMYNPFNDYDMFLSSLDE